VTVGGLRKFQYLLALARERHFGRAAAACNIAQPTLSNAIRQLEQDFGVPIVERGHRFLTFTPEGEKVLNCARRMSHDLENLLIDIGATGSEPSGRLRLGVIPTAVPMLTHLAEPFGRRHPAIRLSISSLSSRQIQAGLDAFELDAGITYLDNEPLNGVRKLPLYSERYFLLTRRGELDPARTETTWAEAASLPLCLLSSDMQNRRITDAAFAMAGIEVTPAVETNSIITLFSLARTGPWSSIVPGQLLALMPPCDDLDARPLAVPEVTHSVGIVYADRSPPTPVAQALARVVSTEGLARRMSRAILDALVERGLTGAPTPGGRRGEP
jgi:DNA-binding transcriptional LysR family regulator